MDLKFLSETPLFRGAAPQEVGEMLSCLGGETRSYPKGAVILQAGEVTRAMGLLLSGRAAVESDDVWGNTSMLDHLGPGQVFGETYASLPEEPLMVSVVASEPVTVLWLDVGRLLRVCPHQCAHHHRLIANLLAIRPTKISTSPAASSTPPPRPFGDGSSPSFPSRPSGREIPLLIFRSPVSSWPTISTWIAAPSPTS